MYCALTSKTPTSFELIVIDTLSNCLGEYWSIERRMPWSYSFWAVYLYDPKA